MYNQRLLWMGALLAALGAFLAACSSGGLTLTAADNGSSITVAPGQTFQVRLEGNPTTGYIWMPDETAMTIQVEMVGDAEFMADSKATGSGGMMILNFKAGESGQGVLRLVYRRPWESNPPEKTFEVNVAISK